MNDEFLFSHFDPPVVEKCLCHDATHVFGVDLFFCVFCKGQWIE